LRERKELKREEFGLASSFLFFLHNQERERVILQVLAVAERERRD
jgi:hypothetical protein